MILNPMLMPVASANRECPAPVATRLWFAAALVSGQWQENVRQFDRNIVGFPKSTAVSDRLPLRNLQLLGDFGTGWHDILGQHLPARIKPLLDEVA